MTPQQQSLLAAQAALAADSLFNSSGDPLDRLVLVQSADGYWSTQTLRNQQLMAGAQQQTTVLYVGGAILALGAVWYFWRS